MFIYDISTKSNQKIIEREALKTLYEKTFFKKSNFQIQGDLSI